MECESGQAIKIAVMKGMGIGILYRDQVESELEAGSLKTLRIAGIKGVKGKSFIVYRKGRRYLATPSIASRCWVDRGKSSAGTEQWKSALTHSISQRQHPRPVLNRDIYWIASTAKSGLISGTFLNVLIASEWRLRSSKCSDSRVLAYTRTYLSVRSRVRRIWISGSSTKYNAGQMSA